MTIIAAAQSCSQPGDIPANVNNHLRLMRIAQSYGVRLLVFPELSLTGYEPESARELAASPDSPQLLPLREFAAANGLTTIVGFPLLVPGSQKPMIASLILGADGTCRVYCKQHLHAGEEVYFAPGPGGPQLGIDSLSVALSVCADFCHPEHPAAAAQAGADLYATSALISENGYEVDSTLLATHARQNRMAVLLANHGAETGGWRCAGRSAFWDESGCVVAEVPGAGEALLLVERVGDRWVHREVDGVSRRRPFTGLGD